jgi:hypothetical protein
MQKICQPLPHPNKGFSLAKKICPFMDGSSLLTQRRNPYFPCLCLVPVGSYFILALGKMGQTPERHLLYNYLNYKGH